MKKLPLLTALVLLCTMTGCLEDKNAPNIPFDVAPTLEPYTAPDGTFDVDAVRSNIYLKGQHFDLPLRVYDLGKGWEYKLYNRQDYGLKDGSGLATIYFNGAEMGTVSLENCFEGKEEASVIYSLSIKTSDCSIYNITPLVSTIGDVEFMLGPPDSVDDVQQPYTHAYHYGVDQGVDGKGIFRGHTIVINFNESGVVDYINITYSDLTSSSQ
ncbi:MAG: hypothetical protein K6G33_07440 [Ruminococcus sp.]|uniref:hypothetical protein n=1 Tax=Ruminococcus sp. TaxID=41978 RepID=UPI0025E70D4E|nr:hypothetical protein [Ruminococcus sp.]MCR5600556.1 hypothetical protein [Ruminococcus sp.]